MKPMAYALKHFSFEFKFLYLQESHFYHRAEHCIVGENKDDLNDGTLKGGIYMKGKWPKAYQGSRFGVCTDDMSG